MCFQTFKRGLRLLFCASLCIYSTAFAAGGDAGNGGGDGMSGGGLTLNNQVIESFQSKVEKQEAYQAVALPILKAISSKLPPCFRKDVA